MKNPQGVTYYMISTRIQKSLLLLTLKQQVSIQLVAKITLLESQSPPC